MKTLRIQRLRRDAVIPERATQGSVGYDLSACIDAPVTIAPQETARIGTGLAIALDQGFAAFLYARSGLGVKSGIVPANCVGVVDSDYRGEIVVGLRNCSAMPFTVKNGDRIAQMVIAECALPQLLVCDALDDTPRGSGGFGSTGR